MRNLAEFYSYSYFHIDSYIIILYYCDNIIFSSYFAIQYYISTFYYTHPLSVKVTEPDI